MTKHMYILRGEDLEEVAALAFVETFKSEVIDPAKLSEFRGHITRIAYERDHKDKAKRSALQQEIERVSLQYEHVAFWAYYKDSKYWPITKVHQRKAGQNKTLCGRLFKPNATSSDRKSHIDDIPMTHPTAGASFFKKCRVCKSLGGLTNKGEFVLWVNEPRKYERDALIRKAASQ